MCYTCHSVCPTQSMPTVQMIAMRRATHVNVLSGLLWFES